MATSAPSLNETLESLTSALSSASETFPDSESTLPPKNGISLLDVKNDALLSYLQNIVFLALLRLRSQPFAGNPAINELIKLRALLERGVKPLEAKLKYQIDKVVSTVTEAEQAAARQAKLSNGKKDSSSSESDSNSSSSGSDSDSDSDSSLDEQDVTSMSKLSVTTKNLAHRPNPASMLLPDSEKTKASASSEKPGIYRPPRIAATSMPELTTSDKASKRERPQRSHMLDEFIDDEVSAAPIAQPSIGSHIASYGRAEKTHRERKEEQERREYEENNLLRLPTKSKKELQQERKRNGAARQSQFGGEDWGTINADLDRLTRSTERRGKGEKLLDKARKRRQDDTEDGPRGDGIGSHFEKRKGMLNKKRRKN